MCNQLNPVLKHPHSEISFCLGNAISHLCKNLTIRVIFKTEKYLQAHGVLHCAYPKTSIAENTSLRETQGQRWPCRSGQLGTDLQRHTSNRCAALSETFSTQPCRSLKVAVYRRLQSKSPYFISSYSCFWSRWHLIYRKLSAFNHLLNQNAG
jgi:hypothetical protein